MAPTPRISMPPVDEANRDGRLSTTLCRASAPGFLPTRRPEQPPGRRRSHAHRPARLPTILLTAPDGAVIIHHTAAALWKVEVARGPGVDGRGQRAGGADGVERDRDQPGGARDEAAGRQVGQRPGLEVGGLLLDDRVRPVRCFGAEHRRGESVKTA
jgi:hypothetical protein